MRDPGMIITVITLIVIVVMVTMGTLPLALGLIITALAVAILLGASRSG